MSMDTVDDLHSAEDLIGRLTAVLRRVHDHPTELDWAADLIAALADADDYCRLTCHGEGEPCGDDCCGCLCHNREPAPTPDPVPLVEVLRDFGEEEDEATIFVIDGKGYLEEDLPPRDPDGAWTAVIDGIEYRYTDGIGFHVP